MRECEAGFTLIELMVTVAVIAILAAIALPSFFGETRKANAASEVQPLFNDIRVRIEQYLQENGKYPPSPAETALQPPDAPGPLKPLGTPAGWDLLKLRTSGSGQVMCRYAWVTGGKGDAVGTMATQIGFVPPPSDWYYLLAKCDMDNGGGSATSSFSWYFASSTDPKLIPLNEGN